MIRTADAEWKGNLKEGSGIMKLGSGGMSPTPRIRMSQYPTAAAPSMKA